MKTRNQETVTLKITRHQLCDMMLACTALKHAGDTEGVVNRKWEVLHDELKAQLDAWNEKYDKAHEEK